MLRDAEEQLARERAIIEMPASAPERAHLAELIARAAYVRQAYSGANDAGATLTTQDAQPRPLLVTPAVRAAARRHFGCAQLLGAELQSQQSQAAVPELHTFPSKTSFPFPSKTSSSAFSSDEDAEDLIQTWRLGTNGTDPKQWARVWGALFTPRCRSVHGTYSGRGMVHKVGEEIARRLNRSQRPPPLRK